MTKVLLHRSPAERFFKNRDGGVALTTALSLAVLLLGVGAAVDYSTMVTERSRLQNSLDAAVLAGASSADTSPGQIKKLVRETTREQFRPTLGTFDSAVTVDVASDDEEITARAQVLYQPAVMSVFGYQDLPIDVSASARFPQVPILNVALVVDVTDSMSGSNLADVQTAIMELITQIEDTEADVHISLVPYSEYVNVGVGNASADWVDASYTEEYRPSWERSVPIYSGGVAATCSLTGPPAPVLNFQDGVQTATGFAPTEVCSGEIPGMLTGYGSETVPSQTWQYVFNGCMGSRDAPANAEPEASAANRIPAGMDAVAYRSGDGGTWVPTGDDDYRRAKCGQPITPLTADFDAVRNGVSSLTTTGDTYLPSGLIWGWQTLSPSVPYAEAAQRPALARSIMIFMTDGENSMHKQGQFHRRSYKSKPNADLDAMTDQARTGLATAAEICARAKGDGVTIYTVAYNLPAGNLSAETGNFLRTCASDLSKAFTATNIDQLKDAFRAITDGFSVVRLSQ